MALRDRLRVLSQSNEHISEQDLKSEWMAAVDRFYDHLEIIFKEYIEQNLLSLQRSSIIINEERLGEYPISVLSLFSGPETIIFTPRARLVAGATGRIDVYNQRRPDSGYILLRQGMSAEGKWTINSRSVSNRLMAAFSLTHFSDVGPLAESREFTRDNVEQMIETMLPQ